MKLYNRNKNFLFQMFMYFYISKFLFFQVNTLDKLHNKNSKYNEIFFRNYLELLNEYISNKLVISYSSSCLNLFWILGQKIQELILLNVVQTSVLFVSAFDTIISFRMNSSKPPVTIQQPDVRLDNFTFRNVGVL